MRATLKDPALQERLDTDGYVAFPLLSTIEVQRLRDVYADLGPAPGDPHIACHSSFHSADEAYKRAVDGAVKRVLEPHLRDRFDRQRALPSNFIVKWPGGYSGFGLHQDLTLVDERSHRSVEVWVALDDTGADNGQLWMVPGSHTWLPAHIRGIQAFPFPFSTVVRRVIERHSKPVPVRAGDAIVFNHATLHFSMPNRTECPRLVAIADLIPEEADHLHFFGEPSGEVGVYAIDDEFWTSNNPFTLWRPPPSSRRVETCRPPPVEFTEADLDRVVAEGRAIDTNRDGPSGAINAGRAWCHRCGSSDVPDETPDRWVGNVTLLCAHCRSRELDSAPSVVHVAPAESLLESDQLVRKGFVTTPVLGAGALEQLREWFDELGVDDRAFYVSCNDAPRALARDIDLRLKRALGPVVDALLPGHVPFLAAFVSKGPSESGEMELHQDLSYVDERYWRTTMVWIPLVDVGPDSGALTVIPGSHRWTSGLRPGGTAVLPTTEVQSALVPHGESVEVGAGTAVVFDNALVHGSSANRSTSVRPAVAIACAPEGAQMIHAHRDGDGPLRLFEIDESFFTTQPFRSVPQGAVEVEPWAEAVRASDLLAALGPTDAGRPMCSPSVTSGSPVSTPPSDRGQRAVRLLPLPGAVLSDQDRDHALRRDGFVTFPLLEPDTAAGLRSAYGALHGWSGSGFEPDLEHPDSSYRRRVSQVLGEVLDPTATALFTSHEPFLRVFLCKWPGDDSELYLHRDWMYVDERQGHRTYVVWVALEDITGHNGQLRVVRRSHRIDAMSRGTALEAPWMQHEDVLRRHLVSVPLRAGEAVVFDNSLVHCSYPNNTGQPRVAAAVGMKPSGVPLVYFRRDGEQAVRYNVDPEFFLTHTPTGLLTMPPDAPVAEVLDPGEVDLTEAQLAGLIRRVAPTPSERTRFHLERIVRRGRRSPLTTRG